MRTTTLFFSKRFLPLFGVQFLGAFNDNLFKSALVMLMVFRLAESPQQAGLLTTLAAGIFILPFFLMSAYAGTLADRYEKTRLISIIKFSEIIIMVFGAWALVSESLSGLFVFLFVMGAQSAFFGPIKYAILPEHLAEHELTQGNAWFSASTFLAILLGTIVGGALVLMEAGTWWTAGLVILVAILGYWMSFAVPTSHLRSLEVSKPISTLRVIINFLKLTQHEVSAARQYTQAFLAVLAISWFWFLGAAYLSQMPVMVKEQLGGNEDVVLWFLTTFSVGIALGAWLVNSLVKRFSALAALKYHGLLLASLSVLMLFSNVAMRDFGWQSEQVPPETLLSLTEFFFGSVSFWQGISHWILWLSLLWIAIVGGAYIVPLYTHLQTHSPEYFRGRMIAVNNIVNSFLMVLSALFFLLGYSLGLDLVQIFYGLALLNLGVALLLHRRIVALVSRNF